MTDKCNAYENIMREVVGSENANQARSTVECVAPDWSEELTVRAFTTTRVGGVSQPPYASCNLGLHVNDDESAVEQNRQQLKQRFSMPVQPVWLKQTHGTRIISVGNDTPDSIDADGSFTCKPNVVLSVLTADCLPVVIRDAKCTQLAVLHAGWRGLAEGIISEAVQKFNPNSQLHAWLGPAIGFQKFEVGEDVFQIFVSRQAANRKHFCRTVKSGKYLADLYGLARDELHSVGCVNVTGGEHCTHSENKLFYSHRRDGVASGRMATIAWLTR